MLDFIDQIDFDISICNNLLKRKNALCLLNLSLEHIIFSFNAPKIQSKISRLLQLNSIENIVTESKYFFPDQLKHSI